MAYRTPATPPASSLYPSSPSRDLITSVHSRVAALFRSGRAGALLRPQDVSEPPVPSSKIYSSPASSISSGRLSPASGRYSPAAGSFSPSPYDTPTSAALKTLDQYSSKRRVFHRMQASDILEGFICNSEPGVGIWVRATKIRYYSKTSSEDTDSSVVMVEGLEIEALCSVEEMEESMETVVVGSFVKTIVTVVDQHFDKVWVSMLNSRINPYTQGHHVLGICTTGFNEPAPRMVSPPMRGVKRKLTASELYGEASHPQKQQRSLSSSKSSSKKNYLELLHDHPLYINPKGLEIMLNAFGIPGKSSLLPPRPNIKSNHYQVLRKQQNYDWAKSITRKALKFARRQEYDSALKCLTHAVEIDPNFADAYVQRGIIYRTLLHADKALIEFNHAIDVDPGNQTALDNLQEIHEESIDSSDSSHGSSSTSGYSHSVSLGDSSQESASDASSSTNSELVNS